jgi:hypothetical protein
VDVLLFTQFHMQLKLEHHGILLKEFNNPEEFKAICGSLKIKRKLRWEKCFSLSHGPIWENIAIKYGLMFGELTNRIEDLMFRLPPIKIDHIKTDYRPGHSSVFKIF